LPSRLRDFGSAGQPGGKQEEVFSAQQEKLNVTAGAAQQQLTDAAASVQSEIEARLAEQVKLAQTQIQEFVEFRGGEIERRRDANGEPERR